MKKFRILTVIAVILIVVAWLLSGILTQKPPDTPLSLQESNEISRLAVENQEPIRVRAQKSTATEQHKTITLQGRIVDREQTTVPALTSGLLQSRLVEHGDAVVAGDVLCEIEVRDREALLEVARDSLTLSQQEFNSTLRLTEGGYQQELDMARSQAALSLSRQQMLATQLELENTKIRAPINGIVSEVHASEGEYLDIGAPCVTLLVLDPLYAQGYISERYVHTLQVGSQARVTLPNGELYGGELSYLSKQAEEKSRTFLFEVTVPNKNYTIFSGVSASIELIVDTRSAHKVPTSVVLLDEEGTLVVKVVNMKNEVVSYAIEILREDVDGIWISGLPTNSTIITLGQGLVVDGERVTLEYE